MTYTIAKWMGLAALTAGAAWGQLVTVTCTSANGPVEALVPYTNSCTAAGGTAPYTWSIVGQNIPPGLTIPPTGNPVAINYTPQSASAYQYSVEVKDSGGLKNGQTFSGAIAPAITITTTSPLPPAAAGSAYAPQQFAATGGVAPYTWSATGLTSGLSMSAAGLLSGTPASAGLLSFNVTVTDSVGGTTGPIPPTFTLLVTPALVITNTTPLPPAAVGVSYQQTLAATGGSGTGYTWSTTGTLPAGLTLSAAGVLSGTPLPAAVSSTFPLTLKDSNNNSISPVYTLPVTLAITTLSALPAATIGTPYNQALTAVGGAGGYTWAVTAGSLPAGLSLSAAGVLSGTPLPAAQNASFNATVTDSSKATASLAFTLPVTLTITTKSPLPPATVGSTYSQTFAAGGGSSPYTWSATGLPAGLTMTAAGLLSGSPPATGPVNFSVTVTDSASATAGPLPFVLPVALTITTSSPLANGAVGAAYNQTVTGTGGTPPYAWTVTTGALPGGLSLNASTGAITGTPSASGTFQFSVQLADSATPANTTTKPFVITINAGVTVTTTTVPNATIGIAYSQPLAATGGVPPYTWSITTGTLPPGLLISTSGLITGTPTTAGPSTFTATVTDSTSNSANRALTLTVVTPPAITTTTLPNGTSGIVYSQTLAATGGTTPYRWTVSAGALPVGLTLSPAGAITGTPTTAGISNFSVLLTDANGVTASQALTLTIISGLTISTTSPLPTGEVSIAYSQTVTATGGAAPYTWSVTTGSTPAGLTLSASGVLSGTPTTAGTFNFTVQVADTNHVTASTPFALTIAAPLGISTGATLKSGSVNLGYSQNLAASGGVAPFTWVLTGAGLPPGLTLSGAGFISGITTTAGTFSFTAKVTDALGATASRQFTIIVVNGLTISSAPTLPGATVGSAYSFAFTAAGGATPYTWTITAGSPPPGVSLKTDGTLSGTPTTAGTFSFTVQVTDSLLHQSSEAVSLTVAPVPAITTTSLPAGVVGAAYSQALAVSGGTPPYTWIIAAGSLPPGLSLSTDGTISGTITGAGTFAFTAKVTDSVTAFAVKQLSIIVTTGLTITTAATLPNAPLNATYSETLAAAGGTAPYSWSVTGGALPAGLSLSAAGVIAGTAMAAGTFTFTATVTDSVSATASLQFSLTVGGGLAVTTTSLPGGKVGTAYSQTLAASGGTPPYTFAVAGGSLPPGIALTGATLSGTPTSNGSYTFTIRVTDSASATATQQLAIAITGLAITTGTPLPGAAVGIPYSVTLAAAGTPPYTWTVTQGTLPDGLSLDATSGTISGTPTAAGSSSVRIQVADNTQATASAAFTLGVVSASYTGISGTAGSSQQFSGTLVPGAAYPADITGAIALTFQPASSLGSPADDPAVQFAGGGRTANFTIPANSTAPVAFGLQTGTVAGTITLSVTWQSGGASIAVPAALTQTIQIAPAVPAITAVSASTTSSGFQVQITGCSNTRELTQAVLQFTAAAGQTLQTTSLTVPLTSAAATWFQSSTSDQYGSQFILTLPFTVSNGTSSAIASISVQLVNSQGTSNSSSATL